MVLSRVHTSTKAADTAKFLLLYSRQVKRCGVYKHTLSDGDTTAELHEHDHMVCTASSGNSRE